MGIYREVPATDHKDRITRDLSATNVTKTKAILTNFITYFKASV